MGRSHIRCALLRCGLLDCALRASKNTNDVQACVAAQTIVVTQCISTVEFTHTIAQQRTAHNMCERHFSPEPLLSRCG